MRVVDLVLKKLGLPDIANFDEARDLIEYCCMRDTKFQKKAQDAFEEATIEIFGSDKINEHTFFQKVAKKKESEKDDDEIKGMRQFVVKMSSSISSSSNSENTNKKGQG